MHASRMCQGVGKSGSPTPRLMTSSIPTTMSKNFLIPEGGISLTVVDRWESGRQRAGFSIASLFFPAPISPLVMQ